MSHLLTEQAGALRTLDKICRDLGVDVVVIGAIALRAHLPDESRLTEDIDVAVALDLDEFSSLTTRLAADGWGQDPQWEPRWNSPEGARVDLLPIGKHALETRRIVWPRAETAMPVVGYRQVFEDSVVHELAPDLRMSVAPLDALAVLKIVAYLDQPELRAKDLGDLLVILNGYEEDGERRFGDDILDAGIEYDEAGAFLLGRDLRKRYEADGFDAVKQFLDLVADADFHLPVHLSRQHRHAAQLFGALASGLSDRS